MSQQLTPISSFTFGCMSFHGQPENFKNEIRVTRAAMDSGVWFHSSQEYDGGAAFMIMRHAFDEDRAHTPKLLLKIRCDHAAVLKFDVEDALRRLNVERVDLVQLCRAKHDRRPVVDDFLAHGEMWQVCQQLEKEGKVGQFVMEIFASFSPDAIRAVNADMFPGYIFYFSPGERQVNNELFELLQKTNKPILSLRTMWGGNFTPARLQMHLDKDPNHPFIARYAALKAIYEKSGACSFAEFSMSFLRSFPNVRTTIAGTSKVENLQALLEADRNAKPMDPSLVAEINALHAATA